MSVKKEVRNFGGYAEEAYGFSQAVKVGDTIYVSGQTAYNDDGTITGPGDMGAQMRQAYENIARLLGMFGATMDAVIDETLFVTDMAAAVAVARPVRGAAYGEKFALASTLCRVAALGSPELLIEIKVTARV